MYLDIPKSCEFGGCKLFNSCPNEEYMKTMHGESRFSPPADRSECVAPCELCEECFSYMDKYNGDMNYWAEMHGIDE